MVDDERDVLQTLIEVARRAQRHDGNCTRSSGS
jgi:hypothetical protein